MPASRFEFEGTSVEQIYAQSFNFWQSKLSERSAHYNIQLAKLIFVKGNEIDAEAYSLPLKDGNRYYLIKIYQGLLEHYNKIRIGNDYIFSRNEHFREIDSVVNLNKLFCQNAQSFAFFHEVGHLCQFARKASLSNGISASFGERQNSSFKFENHLDELDADYFSIYEATYYFFQLWRDDVPTELKTQTNFNIIAAVNLACYFCMHILFQNEEESKLYFQEHSHPHPYVRLVFNEINYVAALRYYRFENVEIDTNSIRVEFETVMNFLRTSGVDYYNPMYNYQRSSYENGLVTQYIRLCVNAIKQKSYHNLVNEIKVP